MKKLIAVLVLLGSIQVNADLNNFEEFSKNMLGSILTGFPGYSMVRNVHSSAGLNFPNAYYAAPEDFQAAAEEYLDYVPGPKLINNYTDMVNMIGIFNDTKEYMRGMNSMFNNDLLDQPLLRRQAAPRLISPTVSSISI